MEKTTWMFVAGSFLTFAGLVLNYRVPINKNMWTSSYSVFMVGLALDVFAICNWLIDVKGHKKWTRPLEMNGLNAITLYALSEILAELSWVVKLHGSDGSLRNVERLVLSTFVCSPRRPDDNVISSFRRVYVSALRNRILHVSKEVGHKDIASGLPGRGRWKKCVRRHFPSS